MQWRDIATQMGIELRYESRVAALLGKDAAEQSARRAALRALLRAGWAESAPPRSSGRFVEEHVRRLSARGIQSAFQFYNINSFETVERMIRRGVYKGPLVMNWVAIGGGALLAPDALAVQTGLPADRLSATLMLLVGSAFILVAILAMAHAAGIVRS